MRHLFLLSFALMGCPDDSADDPVTGPGSCLCYGEGDSDSGMHGWYECTLLGEDEDGACGPDPACTWHADMTCEEAEADRDGG